MSTFKDALANYRQTHSLSAADHRHLDRWGAHDLAEVLWKTVERGVLEQHGVEVSPEGFIAIVLDVRCGAEWADSAISVHRRTSMKLRRALAKALTSDLSDAKVIPLLEQAVKKMRASEPGSSPTVEAFKNLPDEWVSAIERGSPPRILTDPVSNTRLFVARVTREGAGKTRPPKIFMMTMSETMFIACGKRLDDVVATLTDIAFPGPEAVSLDAVRSARRPTTRKARHLKRNTEFPATAGK